MHVSLMVMARRRVAADATARPPLVAQRLSAARRSGKSGHVFWTTMFKLGDKSSAFCATNIATLRAIALYVARSDRPDRR